MAVVGGRTQSVVDTEVIERQIDGLTGGHCDVPATVLQRRSWRRRRLRDARQKAHLPADWHARVTARTAPHHRH